MPEKNYSEPFKVRIIQDCRPEEDYGPSGKLDGHYAICLGSYVYPNISEKARTAEEGNPLLVTDSGDYIWGCECWWDSAKDNKDIPLDLQKRCLETYKGLLRKIMGIDVDPSLN
jgi:hypothetical protein